MQKVYKVSNIVQKSYCTRFSVYIFHDGLCRWLGDFKLNKYENDRTKLLKTAIEKRAEKISSSAYYTIFN